LLGWYWIHTPANIGLQIRDAGLIFIIHHGELQNVVQPVLARPISVLRRDGDRIFLTRQHAKKLKFDVENIAPVEGPKVNAFNPCVGAEDLDAEPVPDQHSNNWTLYIVVESSFNSYANQFTAAKRR